MTQTFERGAASRIEGLPVGRQAIPLKWWASAGGFFLAVQFYAYLRWMLSANFHHVESGPDPIPLSFRIAAHSAEVLVFALLVVGIYRYVFRPWRKQGRLSAVGMLWTTSVTAYWINWGPNWVAPVGNWSGAFWFNRGSWYNFIPGWVSPNGHSVAELSSFGLPFCIVGVAIVPMFLCGLLRGVKARWPSIGPSGILLSSFGLAVIFDFVFEPIVLRAGLYTYGGAIPSLTLFSGRYYQFPIYQGVMSTTILSVLTALLYFTDEHGHTWVERGIGRMQMSKRRMGVLRFLAFTGIVNVAFVGYSVSQVMASVQPSFQWSKEHVEHRSYLIQGLCGRGTDVACPAKGTPIPRKGGARIDPDGNLVVEGRIVGKMQLKY